MAHNMEALSKICLVGPAGVGKTSLLSRASHDAFPFIYRKTLGVDFDLITKKTDSTDHKLQFWDISGAEEPSMLKVYLKESAQVVICFDASATAEVAYKQVQEAIDKIRKATADYDKTSLPHDLPITLMGCKNDLNDLNDLKQRSFYASKILALAREQFPNARSISMFLSSAKDKTAARIIPDNLVAETITFDKMIESLATTSVAPKPAADTGAISQTTPGSAEHHDPDNTESSSGCLGRLLCCFWNSSTDRTTERSSLLGANPASPPTAGR